MRLDNENSIVPLEDADPREEILHLEDEIESLAEILDRCRKIDLAAKVALAGGAIVLVGFAIGIVQVNELILICAITAVIGGIVGYGSNLSTSRQAVAELKTAEARRVALIDGSKLRVIQ